MIGNNIKFIRKAHDLTRPEFARIISISPNSLSSYEKGTSIISTELIDKICQKNQCIVCEYCWERKNIKPSGKIIN